MKKIFFALAALVAFAAAGCTLAPGENEVRVISYNIRYLNTKDGDNSWEFRKHASINMVNNEKPTVFGLQEAVKAQVDFLNENLPDFDYYGVGRDDGVEKGEFMAIFYNKKSVKLLDKGTFWLSATPDTPSKGWDGQCRRTCTWTILKMKATGEKFAYFNTHLDHRGKQAKAEGMKLLAAKVKELVPEGMTVFMTGDFNTRPENEIFNPLREVLTDSRVAAPETDNRPTSNGWKKEGGSIIDYVLFRGAEPLTYKVLRDKNYGAEFISDHYPVVMTATF